MTKLSENQNANDIVLYTVMFLFLFQVLAEFIEAIYAFGLLGTSIPPEIASALFLLAPSLLLMARRGMTKRPFLALGLLFLLSRLVAVMLDTRGRMLVSGVGTAAGLIWFSVLLWQLAQRKDHEFPVRFSLGLLGGVLLSVFFRVLGSGIDISTTEPFQSLGWLLAVVAAIFLIRQAPTPSPTSTDQPPAFGRLTALSLGLVSALVMLYFVFTSPQVIARWTGTSYPVIISLMMLALGLFTGITVFRNGWLAKLGRGFLWGWNGIFVLALIGTILPHQIRLPSDPSGYPFYEPAISFIETLPLYLMLLLFPVIFVDFALYARATMALRPSLPALGGAYTLAALYLLALIFSHVFTTVYDYIPLIGPFFRDKFWLVHLVAGLGLMLPLLVTRRITLSWQPLPRWGGGILLLMILVIGAMLMTMARPSAPSSQSAVRFLTYNIQQGYSETGLKNFAGQLDLIREVNADIIGLQESDTSRIAGGNADIVRYFADALDMHVYYGPKTIPGTFGIALLSKYPIQNPRTFYMYSEGEQTATIEATIPVGEIGYNVFVTHLGNGGPLEQQQAIMQVVGEKENAVLMGDFNFRPQTEQYALTTAILKDAWLERWPDGVDDLGVQPDSRIDHIFVSPGTIVEDIRYILDAASDHPAVMAVLKQP
jgi:endonuclease/exonuclease/phosphatase family metal-dependent hydrolase